VTSRESHRDIERRMTLRALGRPAGLDRASVEYGLSREKQAVRRATAAVARKKQALDAAALVLAERERCARIADQFPNLMAAHIAKLIRGA
jgi:hypothetical protein